MAEQLYLRSNVVVEPLIHHWYAWSHLIPPATAARNATERHLRIMDSFIQCIRTGADPLNDGAAGLRVVKMLEAANKSLRKRGALVYL